jgi:Leucine-rich repeat (LRR) protein
LPVEICKLINLQTLYLGNNSLKSLPVEITRLINLKKLYIDESSYEINNLDIECEILIFKKIKNPITNLPYGLKELYLKKDIKISMIKIPFGCEIKYI